MSKAADIYWNNPRRNRPQTVSRRKPAAKAHNSGLSWWVSFGVAVTVFVMLCISINLRAVSDVAHESDQNAILSDQVRNLLDENLALQEEIHLLKTDPKIIEREARRLGLGQQNEKVPVSGN